MFVFDRYITEKTQRHFSAHVILSFNPSFTKEGSSRSSERMDGSVILCAPNDFKHA